MQEQQGTPDETPGTDPRAKWTQKTLCVKRGTTPALQATPHAGPDQGTSATARLSTRDLRLLCWMAEQYGARLDHLRALMGIEITSTREIARKLRHDGMVRTERIVSSEPMWVIPTAEGLAACGMPYEVWTPALGQLPHISAINDVRIHMQARTPDAHWICERELISEYADVNAGRRPHAREHRPDGVAIREGHSIAVEVELSLKGNVRLEGILDELARRYDAVLYFCAPGPYLQLKRMEQTGRWRSLAVRELPGLPRPGKEAGGDA